MTPTTSIRRRLSLIHISLVAEASADVVTAHMAADRAVRTLQTVAQRIEEYADAA